MPGVDRVEIRKVVRRLFRQYELAIGDDKAGLAEAILKLQPLTKEPTPAKKARKQQALKVWVVPVPDDVLAAMLSDGADIWLEAVFGIPREGFRHHRKRLGLPPAMGTGGSAAQRRQLRAAWLAKWEPQLLELGILPEAKSA